MGLSRFGGIFEEDNKKSTILLGEKEKFSAKRVFWVPQIL